MLCASIWEIRKGTTSRGTANRLKMKCTYVYSNVLDLLREVFLHRSRFLAGFITLKDFSEPRRYNCNEALVASEWQISFCFISATLLIDYYFQIKWCSKIVAKTKMTPGSYRNCSS